MSEIGHFTVAEILLQHCRNISQSICNIAILQYNISAITLQPFCAEWVVHITHKRTTLV